jgi:ABC-2 type transport system permease protein
MDYLCDDSGIIEVRAKEIKLRLLDKGRLKTERLKWQLVNLFIPIAIMLIFGLVNKIIRKRKYTL